MNMERNSLFRTLFTVSLLFLTFVGFASFAWAQEIGEEPAKEEEPFDEGLFPEPPLPGSEQPPPIEAGQAERVEGGEAGEGETSWSLDITGAVVMNYSFTGTPGGFTVKYKWEIKGRANAATAVVRGDVDINADVEGTLAKWATGECRLEVTIPKIPFELTFRRTGDEKSNIRIVFKRSINEDWQSKCTFTDSPNARFDTRGAPENWLTKALDKARPPLKDIVADIGTEETTTTFVISKESFQDPPIGTVEMEGTGVITIKPGG